MAEILATIFTFLFNILLWISPLLGTFFLGFIAWKLWLHYVQQDFIAGIDYALLEIIPPRDVLRSPKGMELFFSNALYHKSNKGGLEEFWQGAVWFWFSLEIVSIDGQVHFYVRTPTRVKGLIETQMYAQYPQAQVREVEDYTLAVDKISKTSEYGLWGCEFELEKPEAYPIKTYVDFGLDKDPKEEFKVDPISPVIELFGSIQKGEQMWLQFVVRADHVKKYHTKGTWFKKHGWVKEAQNELDKMLKPFTSQKLSLDKSVTTEIRSPAYLDPVIKGINGKITKIGLETGIRFCYVAKKEVFNMNSRKNARLIFRQYANPFMNEFKRCNNTQPDAFAGNTFQSFFLISQKTVTKLADRMLEEYREREFYYPPLRHAISGFLPWPISPVIFPKYFHHHTFILNVEELATVWHFPGQILKVPTLERIESKEASPPTNLPM